MGGRGRNRGKIAIGGGAGLLLAAIALLLGINPGDLLGGGQMTDPGGSATTPFAQCTRGSDINADRECRFVAYTNSIQDYWAGSLRGYQEIKVETFEG
jgi:predicted metalloprotease